MSIYNKSNNTGEKPSDIKTPLHLCNYLYNLVKDKYDKPNKVILDCCAGDKRLTNNFKYAQIITYEIKEGTDFLEEDRHLNVDLCIFNPPFNAGTGKKLLIETFLDKVLELCNFSIGIIMITPMGFRLNNNFNSKRRVNFKKNKYPEITSIISLPMDIFYNTLFHCEVLIFNIDFLKPHYWY